MAWAEETLGAAVNEIYGQTECNLVAGGCSMLLERRLGAIGVPIPGHVVEVVDDEGELVEPGGTGHLAVRQPDPVAMLSYWRTARRERGEDRERLAPHRRRRPQGR